MTAERTLLYVSPVVPDLTGNGLAIRSGMVLRLLAERYEVSLLVVPLHGPVGARLPAALARRCQRAAVLPIEPGTGRRSAFLSALRVRWPATPETVAAPPHAWPFAEVEFGVVHLFRLTALPYGVPYLFGRWPAPERHIDLDEAESATRRRLAAFYRLTGDSAKAQFAELEARLCARLEREILERFDRIYVCSPAERQALGAGAVGPEVRVLPNALPPPRRLPDPPPGGPFRFLFVGTLAFLPNEDAVRHFCLDVLPRLRRIAPRAFEFVIVGVGATAAVRELAGLPEVRLVGAVPSVIPWYRDADAVVVPLRAGGGMRIKVLEAMSYRRPVVSTPEGVEGLAVEAERDVLVADSAQALAEQCVRLMRDPALAARLARHAYNRFLDAYTLAAVAGVLEP